MKFKKAPLEEKKSAAPLVHSEPAIGEVIRPASVTSKSESEKAPIPAKPIKVHTYNWVLLLLALVLTVIALLVFTGRGKPPQLTAPQDKTRSFERPPADLIPEGDGGEVEPLFVEMPIISESPKEERVPAQIQLSEDNISFSAQSLLDMPIDKNIFISCAKGRFKILSISLEPSVSGLSLDSKKCEEISIFKEKIDTCALALSWDYNKTESFKKKTNVIVEWEDLSSLESKVYEEVIPVSLSYSAPVPKKKFVAPVFEKPEEDPFVAEELFSEEAIVAEKEAPKEDKSFFDNLFSFGDEKEEPLLPVKKSKSKRGRRHLNCRKYAGKAYSVEGDFIGWIRPNGEVYSPQCSEKIGKRGSDGEVKNLDGRLLGYDSSFYLEKLRSKRAHASKMKMPEHLIDFEEIAKPLPTDWTSVAKSRSGARGAIAKSKPKKTGAAWGRHQMKDHMGILRSAKMEKVPFTIKDVHQISTMPKDEEYVIRRNKPIPAALAYPLQNNSNYGGVVPATAIVERNIYGGSGRTVVIPAGSLILGHAIGSWPNTYTRFARVALVWDRLVRPDGAEFIFKDKPISGDAQGKLGVPGKGSTDYMEQFVKPMITSLVPAAINLISPTAEIFTRKILTDSDGDLNILETGESTSKEKAKKEMIATWNKIAHKLVEDTLENTTPPFVVPAGTRITIYPKTDIMLRFVDDDSLFGGKGFGARVLADQAPKQSVKESKIPQNSAAAAVKNIDKTVAAMHIAQAVRNKEQEAAAAAFAEANKQEDYAVSNNDPLSGFEEGGEDPIVGKLADGSEVAESMDGILYSLETDQDVDEQDVEFYD